MDRLDLYGPRDTTVLYAQSRHRSEDVCMGGDAIDMTIRAKHGSEPFWRLDNTSHDDGHFRLHYRVVHMLHDMGFYGVYRCGYFEIDSHLMTALVERWRPEKHTFHFPVGEASITLQDVAVIWGLPIEGGPIIGVDTHKTVHGWQEYCLIYLGFLPEVNQLKGSRIHLTALKQHMLGHPVTDDSADIDVERFCRCCALYLMGSVMCPDSSGNKVSLLYVRHMEQMSDARGRSWGSAVLAFLYRELCNAACRGKQQIGGPLHLLQIWAWSRITTLAPINLGSRINVDPIVGPDNHALPHPPYGARWVQHHSFTRTSRRSVRVIRDILDKMEHHQFIWTPYDLGGPRIKDLGARCLTDVWRSSCPLINYAIVELHHPERVMRQFCMTQCIPSPVPAHHETLHKLNRRGRSSEDWGTTHQQYVVHWTHRNGLIVSAPYRDVSRLPDEGYIRWYENITRRLISPSLSMTQGYQPSPSAACDAMERAFEKLKISLEKENDYEAFKRSFALIYNEVRPYFRANRASFSMIEQQQEALTAQLQTNRGTRRRRTREAQETGTRGRDVAGPLLNLNYSIDDDDDEIQ